MNSFGVWRVWLLALSLFLVFFGLVLAFLGQSDVMNTLFHRFINPVFWKTVSAPDTAIQFQAWIYGLLGATISGWGMILFYFVKNTFKPENSWSWKGIAYSVLFWFSVDSFVSWQHEVFFNIFINLIVLVLFAVPLVFTFKNYFGSSDNGLR